MIIVLFLGCVSPEYKDDGLVYVADGVFCCLMENKDIRTYHIKGPVSCGQWGVLLAATIYHIEGVQSVYPTPYEITVTKSCLYDWKDIEAEIVKCHKKALEQMAEFEPDTEDESGGV